MTHKVPGQGKSRGLVGWERKTLGCHRDTEGGQERWGGQSLFSSLIVKKEGHLQGRGWEGPGTAGLCVEKENDYRVAWHLSGST